MSTNSIFRISGIASILSAVFMVVGYATMGPNMTPTASTPMIYLLSIVCGLIMAIGLYLVYRSGASTLSLVAAALSVLGYVLFIVTTISGNMSPTNPMQAIADILVFIVGMGMFSWLAYSSSKMPRILAIIGIIGAIAGAISYVLGVVLGGGGTEPTGITAIFYYVYFLGVLIWLIWTGYWLVAGKVKTA